MSETVAGLRRKIATASDLHSVVRTMKALAASNIGQYEKSVRALAGYYRTLELGLGACFREHGADSAASLPPGPRPARAVGAVIFGSDQGLVGRFNEVIAEEATTVLRSLGGAPLVWAVGERVHGRLANAGLTLAGLYPVPSSVQAIPSLVGTILVECVSPPGHQLTELHLFHNQPSSDDVYTPTHQRLLPMDGEWRRKLRAQAWPTRAIPEVLGGGAANLAALIREYLFVSVFRACAESLSSENASRLAAMERADKNIESLLETLNGVFHRLRQTSIDEELFDVVSGFEALAKQR